MIEVNQAVSSSTWIFRVSIVREMDSDTLQDCSQGTRTTSRQESDNLD